MRVRHCAIMGGGSTLHPSLKGLTIWESFLFLLAESLLFKIDRFYSADQLLTILQLSLASGADVKHCRHSYGFPSLNVLLAHSLGACDDSKGGDLDKLKGLLVKYGLSYGKL